MREHPDKVGVASRGTEVSFGSFGLKSMSAFRVESKQIEAARKALSRHLSKTGKLWIRIFPDMPVTKKPAEVKMGKGKGNPEAYVARVRPGRMIFEVDGVSEEVAREALRKAGTKLPLKTKIVKRN